jgi:hypothetical protein
VEVAEAGVDSGLVVVVVPLRLVEVEGIVEISVIVVLGLETTGPGASDSSVGMLNVPVAGITEGIFSTVPSSALHGKYMTRMNGEQF